nr:MAG TPA: hypothetical protein [Caudoviricetes sp.]
MKWRKDTEIWRQKTLYTPYSWRCKGSGLLRVSRIESCRDYTQGLGLIELVST